MSANIISNVIYDIDKNIIKYITTVYDKISFIIALYEHIDNARCIKMIQDVLYKEFNGDQDLIRVILDFIETSNYSSLKVKLYALSFITSKLRELFSLFNEYELTCYRKLSCYLDKLNKKMNLIYIFWKSDCWSVYDGEDEHGGVNNIQPTVHFIEYLYYLSFLRQFKNMKNWYIIIKDTIDNITFSQIILDNLEYIFKNFKDNEYHILYSKYLEFHTKITNVTKIDEV
jgi:hypothetical protein